jgi:uncharacterized protein (TIGR03437 family)
MTLLTPQFSRSSTIFDKSHSRQGNIGESGVGINMKMPVRGVWGVCIGLFLGCSSNVILGQTLGNQSLKGNYYFRYVSMGATAAGALNDPRSALGTMIFDGAGNYTFTGQQVTGTAAAASASGFGTYTVDPAGFVTMTSPIRTGDQVNARLGPEALIGSGTETTDNTFDLLVAIPAPTAAVALTGPYNVVTLEFPGGNAANAIDAIFTLNSAGPGSLAAISVYGHTPGVSSGSPTTQQVTGATYSVPSAGAGTLTFGSASALLSGSKNVYISADGNVIIGGSVAAGAHDFLIGVKAVASPALSSWNGAAWTAGLRYESATSQPAWISHAGSLKANGAGSTTLYRRLKALGAGASDFTASDPYAINPSGTAAVELTQVGLGAGGTFVGAAIDPSDPGGFEIYFGAPMAPMSGSGVFLNPQGVLSAASFAPAGNPISPGEFIALFGTGLAASTQTAKPPYPTNVNNVTVTIGGIKAPIYFVSANQINCLVPYAIATATTTIVVTNGSTPSNSVTVPVAPTAPGIYSLNQSGTGSGAIEHANGSVVNASNPANPGETVMVFLTGMGAVTPTVTDGVASTGNPLNKTLLPVVYVADQQASVAFSGLTPGFPGLYQINVTIPTALSSAGNYPLAVLTNNAFHDQIYIPVQ